MQLRKMTLMLVALGAMSMVLTGCPEDAPTLTCSADADCLESELCHPNAKVCVQKCTSSAECPDTAKTCEALDPANASSQKICKCSTTALCNTGRETADLVCLTETYKVCAPKCSTDTDCAADQTCDTTAGVCKPKSTTGNTCSGEGRTTCNYGEFCSSSRCAAVPAPTCDNYQNFTQKNQLGTTGPIIFRANTESAAVDSFCGTGSATPKRVRVKLSAYSNTPFPDDKDDLNGFFYVTVNGNQNSGPALISTSAGNYVVTGTNRDRADMIVSFCVAQNSTTLSLGFYFRSGNFLCYQANY